MSSQASRIPTRRRCGSISSLALAMLVAGGWAHPAELTVGSIAGLCALRVGAGEIEIQSDDSVPLALEVGQVATHRATLRLGQSFTQRDRPPHHIWTARLLKTDGDRAVLERSERPADPTSTSDSTRQTLVVKSYERCGK